MFFIVWCDVGPILIMTVGWLGVNEVDPALSLGHVAK